VASNLENQLTQLDELLGLLDSNALRGAQETVEHQIVELTERLEVTRQALAQAQAQRRRLARARLLLEDSGREQPNTDNGVVAPPAEDDDPESTPSQSESTIPFVAERRSDGERRTSADRRQVTDRRKSAEPPLAS
jgi:hypothetical protein